MRKKTHKTEIKKIKYKIKKAKKLKNLRIYHDILLNLLIPKVKPHYKIELNQKD